MSGAGYQRRRLDITVQLGKGSFGESGLNTLKVSGLRVRANVLRQGPPSGSHASVSIYGLTPSQMNQFSTLGVPLPMDRLNTLIIEAGDDVNGMAACYQGNIQNAWQDFNGAPETFFSIDSWIGTFDLMKPVPPISFASSADVATIMSGLATRMGRSFENNGVQVQLQNPYFAGTAMEQAHAVARAANINMYDDGFTLSIWPQNGTRGGAIPLISSDSGLVGWPRYRDQGMTFTCLFNPNITFGGRIEMQSKDIPAANGQWYVNGLIYDLSSELVGGPWFCDVACVRQPNVPAHA